MKLPVCAHPVAAATRVPWRRPRAFRGGGHAVATLLLARADQLCMFGGGGMNPRKMQQMMKQMGIDVTDVEAEEVVIRTADEEYVFDAPTVQRMDAQGQETFQVVGDYDLRERGAGDEPAEGDADADADDGAGADAIPAADVEIVATRTGASEADARAALEATDGDLAAAVSRLE